ncbi:hypothetical protein BDZ91DRAFT_323268 [Kalaharituber pfeilii]|nr:hypothetical protein BDZ91DRAFT_323268 [Kalaharituber pfeilii]
MSTIPSTPPRRTRVETPEAPLHGPTYDKQREKKEKEKSKMPKEKTKATSSVTSKTKAPAVTFALSPPGSPGSTGLPSPGPFDKDKEKTTAAATEAEDDPFVGPSLPSTTKFKKFKPPSVAQSIKNPFAKEISQQSNGAESLPTPAKTPSRKRKYMPPIEAEEELNSTSQVLFSDKTTSKTSFASKASETTLESILGGGSSSRATSRRKVNRGSLGRALGEDLFGSSDLLGSRTSGSGSTIEIYTDSNARVPEYDPSPDNPFVDHPPSVRRETEKTRKLRAKIKESETEFEALKAGREDGMVYTLYDFLFLLNLVQHMIS